MNQRVSRAILLALALSPAACGKAAAPEVLECEPTGDISEWTDTILISTKPVTQNIDEATGVEVGLAGEVECNSDVVYSFTTVGRRVPVTGFVELCVLQDFTRAQDQLAAATDPHAASRFLLAVCPDVMTESQQA